MWVRRAQRHQREAGGHSVQTRDRMWPRWHMPIPCFVHEVRRGASGCEWSRSCRVRCVRVSHSAVMHTGRDAGGGVRIIPPFFASQQCGCQGLCLWSPLTHLWTRKWRLSDSSAETSVPECPGDNSGAVGSILVAIGDLEFISMLQTCGNGRRNHREEKSECLSISRCSASATLFLTRVF